MGEEMLEDLCEELRKYEDTIVNFPKDDEFLEELYEKARKLLKLRDELEQIHLHQG